ncbi:MAG: oligosaccharide flippase family protein, partial [Verrucomicrobiota bacterium]
AAVFVVTPLMIRELGDVRYGVWLVAMAVIGYFQILDLGVTVAGTRFLAREIGKGNQRRYQAYLSTLFWIYRNIGLAVIPLTAVVVAIAPIFLGEGEFEGILRWILLAFGLDISVRFFTRVFRVILRSHLRYDLLVAGSLVKTILQTVSIIALLPMGYDLPALIVIHVAVDLVEQLLVFLFARRVDGTIKVTTRLRRRALVKEVLKYGSALVFFGLGKGLRNGVDPLLIGGFSGLARVPIYSIGNRFLETFTDLVNAVFGGHLLAALSQVEGKSEREKIRDSFLRITRLSAAFAMLGGCGLAFYAPDFIERWVGEGFDDSAKVVLILVIPHVIMLAQYPAYGLLMTTGRERQVAMLGFIGGILNLAASLVLLQWIGFFGVVWGTALELTLVYLWVVPFLVSRAIDVSVFRYLITLLPGFFIVGTLSLAWYALVRNWFAPDYLRLFLLGSGHSLLVFLGLWITLLSSDQRHQILTMFRRLT